MSELLLEQEIDMARRFSGEVTPEERNGYEGFIIKPEKLVEVMTTLRDELGFDYLSSVSGVDYLPDEQMEVVYHLINLLVGRR